MDEAEVLRASEDDDGLDFRRWTVEDDATDAGALAAEIKLDRRFWIRERTGTVENVESEIQNWTLSMMYKELCR